MNADLLEGDSRFIGKIQCSVDMPDQSEVDEGRSPYIVINADDLLLEAFKVAAEESEIKFGAFFQVDLLKLFDSCLQEDSRYGSDFVAEQADILAEWLEIFAKNLRDKYRL